MVDRVGSGGGLQQSEGVASQTKQKRVRRGEKVLLDEPPDEDADVKGSSSHRKVPYPCVRCICEDRGRLHP